MHTHATNLVWDDSVYGLSWLLPATMADAVAPAAPPPTTATLSSPEDNQLFHIATPKLGAQTAIGLRVRPGTESPHWERREPYTLESAGLPCLGMHAVASGVVCPQ